MFQLHIKWVWRWLRFFGDCKKWTRSSVKRTDDLEIVITLKKQRTKGVWFW